MILHRDLVSGIVAAGRPGSAECDMPVAVYAELRCDSEPGPVTLYWCPLCDLFIPCDGLTARNQYPATHEEIRQKGWAP